MKKIQLSKNAQLILEQRYLKKNESGKVIEKAEIFVQKIRTFVQKIRTEEKKENEKK